MYTTLISAPQLQALRDSGIPCMVFDCSFDLLQPDAGPAMYARSHIAGAVYAHLDTALSAKGERAHTGAMSGGRHPLPSREAFARWLTAVGFENTMQAVVYDRQGANYCGRLWWMLKWLGHNAVAVLDGGMAAWVARDGALEANLPAAPLHSTERVPFALSEPKVSLVGADMVLRELGRTGQTIVDARAAPRFRGEVEPLDPVAGHIPGALNRPFALNLTPEGFFKPAKVLRAEWDALLGTSPAQFVVHQCGSGVSAIPNLLAMEIAGLHGSALFAGSWSEWCSDPSRPFALG
jgi:thiosulfate/3-mercaptopyruvate sulfurtransferase